LNINWISTVSNIILISKHKKLYLLQSDAQKPKEAEKEKENVATETPSITSSPIFLVDEFLRCLVNYFDVFAITATVLTSVLNLIPTFNNLTQVSMPTTKSNQLIQRVMTNELIQI
jgi:hypothetical protein